MNTFVKINPPIIINSIKNVLWVIVLRPPRHMFSEGTPTETPFPDSLKSNCDALLPALSSTLAGLVPGPHCTASPCSCFHKISSPRVPFRVPVDHLPPRVPPTKPRQKTALFLLLHSSPRTQLNLLSSLFSLLL